MVGVSLQRILLASISSFLFLDIATLFPSVNNNIIVPFIHLISSCSSTVECWIDHKNPNSAHSGLIHLWAWLRYTDLSPRHTYQLWLFASLHEVKNYLHLPFRLRLNFSTNNNHHTVLCQKFTSLREGLLFLSYDMFV